MVEEEVVVGKWKHFTFKMINPEKDIPRVITHLESFLYSSMNGLGYDDSMASDWSAIFVAMMNDEDKLSLMAEDEDGKIAGMRMIRVHRKSDIDQMPNFQHQQTKEIWNFFMDLDKKCKIFEHYPNVTEYAELFGISVDPKHRQQSLANELYRRSILLLKLKGYQLAKCTFSSPYSRKAAQNNGYKELARSFVSEWKNSNGRPLVTYVDPEFFIDTGVFEVQNVALDKPFQ